MIRTESLESSHLNREPFEIKFEHLDDHRRWTGRLKIAQERNLLSGRTLQRTLMYRLVNNAPIQSGSDADLSKRRRLSLQATLRLRFGIKFREKRMFLEKMLEVLLNAFVVRTLRSNDILVQAGQS